MNERRNKRMNERMSERMKDRGEYRVRLGLKRCTLLQYFGGLAVLLASKEAKSPSKGGGVIIFSFKSFCIAELSLHAEF